MISATSCARYLDLLPIFLTLVSCSTSRTEVDAAERRTTSASSGLAKFAIDERTPLTAAELSATIRQVMSAKSGVYLPAAYAPEGLDLEKE